MNHSPPRFELPAPGTRDYQLVREQWIDADREAVFEFFSDPGNLERITPPWLAFRVLDPVPAPLSVDTRIQYRISLLGVPLRWVTRITAWESGERFVDCQERGPYAFWEHTHGFQPLGEGVLMTDCVRYRLPFGLLGRLVHALWVHSALTRIFDYRFARIRELFANAR